MIQIEGFSFVELCETRPELYVWSDEAYFELSSDVIISLTERAYRLEVCGALSSFGVPRRYFEGT